MMHYFQNNLIQFKKFFYLLLLLVLVAACSEKKKNDDEPPSTPPSNIEEKDVIKTTIQITDKDYKSIVVEWKPNKKYPLSKLFFTTPASTTEKYFGLENTYKITDLEPDTRYFFKVHYCKSYDECYEKVDFITVKTDPFTPPENLTTRITHSNAIIFNWDLYEYADHYKIYQIEAGTDDVEIYSGVQNTYTSKILKQNTSYTFGIKSCIQLDKVCSIYNIKTVKIASISNANGFSGKVLDASIIDLYFDSPADNLIHKLYYGLSENDNKTLLYTATANSTTYRVQGLNMGIWYTFWSQTCLADSSECSLFTNPIRIQTIKILPPSEVNTSIESLNKIALKWTKVRNADYYKIYQSKDDVLNKKYLFQLTENATTINNLDLNTDYYYWVVSCTPLGECSSFSNQQLQRTQKYKAPSDFQATSSSTKTIELAWKRSLAEYDQTYYIYYTQVNDYDQAQLLNKTDQQSYFHYGLNLDETYYFWIKSCLDKIINICSDLSQVLEKSTTNIQPPKNISGEEVSSSTIKLFWATKPYIEKYTIEVYSNINQAPIKTVTVDGSIDNTIFNNLDRNNTYYFKIKSCIPTQTVCSDYSNFIELKTENISEPFKLVTKFMNSQRVGVSWDYYTNDNLIEKFKLFVVSHSSTLLVYEGSKTSFVVENLYADTNYSFVAKSCSNSDLCSNLSIPLVVKTNPVPMPKNVQLKETSRTSMLLTWEGNSESLTYKIYKITDATTIEDKTLVYNNTDTNYPIKDLQMDDAYKFIVHSCNVLNQCSQGVAMAVSIPPIAINKIDYTYDKNNNEHILSWAKKSDDAYYKIIHYSEFENKYYDLETVAEAKLKLKGLLPTNHIFYISACNDKHSCSDPYEFKLTVTELINLFQINQNLYTIDLNMDTSFGENEFVKFYMQGTKKNSTQSYNFPATVSGSYIQVSQLEYSQDYNFVLYVCDLVSADCAHKKAISHPSSTQTQFRNESLILWLGTNNSILEYYVNQDAQFISTPDSGCNTINFSTCTDVSQANLLKTPQNLGDRYKKDGLNTSTVTLNSINRSKVIDNSIANYYGFLKNSYLDEFNQTQYYNTQFMIGKQKNTHPQNSRGNSVIFRNNIYIIGGSNQGLDARIWKTPDGINFASSAKFPAGRIYGNSTIAFKDYIYVMGGRIEPNSNTSTQIWRSKDGENWNDMGKSPWEIGLYALSFVFKDTLYYIPSQTVLNQNSKIWKTTSGTNWIEVNQKTPMPARSGASYVELDGYVYIIGGYDWDLTQKHYRNDIWRSNDMENWEQVTSNIPMKDLAYAQALIYNNVMYFIGGKGDLNYSNAVWKSTDGKNWTLVTDNADFEKRAFHSAEVFNNRMYVIGGNGDSATLNDTWHSTNGKDWKKAVMEDKFSPLYSLKPASKPSGSSKTYQILKFKEQVYLINTHSGKVYHSEDGVDFQIMGELPFSNRHSTSMSVYKNKIYIFGGEHYSNYNQKYHDAYWTEDGITWHNLNVNYDKVYKNALFEHKDKFYMLGGVDITYQNSNTIWVSETGDSDSWIKLNTNFEFGLYPVVQTHNGVIYVYVSGVNQYEFTAFLYKSVDDGITWTQIADKSDFGNVNRWFASFFIFNDKFFITSGSNNDTQADNHIYVSNDFGGSWHKSTDGVWSARNRIQPLIFKDHIYLYGGAYGNTAFADIYRSSNGTDWYQSYWVK